MKKNINSFLSIYLLILFIFSVFFLNEKHIVENDSTISEWIINYAGGFTKRGIIGQINVYLSYLFKINLRDSILILQILILLTYFLSLYFFFKNIKINKLMMLSIFTPIFILYPVAEIEVLARKEIFIFCIFLAYLTIEQYKFKIIYKIFLLPLAILIWEPVIFFFPFWIVLDIVNHKLSNFREINYRILPSFLPSISVVLYIVTNPISLDNHQILSEFLKNEFNEICYMSCALLKSKSTIYQQFHGNFHKYSFEVFLRYFLIILIGFGPLFILSFNSKINVKNLFFFRSFNNLLLPILLLLSPVIILFAMGYDWGRWVNISYFFSIVFYFYLYKNNFLEINILALNKVLNILNNKKIFFIIFVFFCLGWNPKTVISGDVASFPGYRIPYKTFKIINFKYLNF